MLGRGGITGMGRIGIVTWIAIIMIGVTITRVTTTQLTIMGMSIGIDNNKTEKSNGDKTA